MKKKSLQHLGIILDGNRRWAKERGLSSMAGHKEGAEAVKRTLLAAIEKNIPYLTVYAFSTENWKRTEEEVAYLMSLVGEYIGNATDFFTEHNIRVRIFGDLENQVDMRVATALRLVEKNTAQNTSLHFSVCFNYGGRAEIVRAVKEIMNKKISVDDITETVLSEHMYSADIPDPDMIVRTSGERRLSNFLTWQSVYSELYFMDDIHWPDFDAAAIEQVLDEYTKRQRRFGA